MRPSAPGRAWRALVELIGPSVPLALLLLLYRRFDGTPHFFVHTLIGWDVALLMLLGATYRGHSQSRWDAVLPLGLALYALAPDFIYIAGPPHSDWMDLFLFHIALDEILPFAVPVLAVLWLVLLIGYVRFRARSVAESLLWTGGR